MTGGFGSSSAAGRRQAAKPVKQPGNPVNLMEPRKSGSAISPRTAPSPLPTPPRAASPSSTSGQRTPLPELSPTSVPLPARSPPAVGNNRRASHGRSFSHAPTVHENLPPSSRSDYPFPQPGPSSSATRQEAPSFNFITATPDLGSDVPQFSSPFRNASPFDGYGPPSTPSTPKISPKAKHARRQSLQLLQVGSPSAAQSPRPSSVPD